MPVTAACAKGGHRTATCRPELQVFPGLLHDPQLGATNSKLDLCKLLHSIAADQAAAGGCASQFCWPLPMPSMVPIPVSVMAQCFNGTGDG